MQNTPVPAVAAPRPLPAQAALSRAAQGGDAGREFLAFKLGDEEYGIDILRVREIRSYEAPTRIANAPAFVMGVINLRGVIVPVVDMRVKLGLSSPRYDAFTVVIVLSIGNRVVGMVVDSVCDVVTLSAQQMLSVPEFNAQVAAEHLMAMGSVDERMLILVDIEKLMTSADMALFNAAQAPALVS
jgi:purine-binding chemotaxis protein CheW